jgi:hypothetical protein
VGRIACISLTDLQSGSVDVLERWTRHLRAKGRSASTISSFRTDACKLREFIAGDDLLSVDGDTIRRFLDADRTGAAGRRR